MTTNNTNTVRLHRVLRATPEKVYRAFLDAEAMAKWLPPNGFTAVPSVPLAAGATPQAHLAPPCRKVNIDLGRPRRRGSGARKLATSAAYEGAMTTTLIGRDDLEVDAVVPQCLDNQYLSDSVFEEMHKRGVDYTDPAIAAMRERDFRTEFIRSIVYASQVVVQRAYFKNSDFLYRNYRPEDRQNLLAFASLMREKAIVPFLFRESSLRDRLQFDLRKEGERAGDVLLDELGDDVTCVRLSVEEAENQRLTDNMTTAFGSGISRLTYMSEPQRNAMASELFSDPGRLQAEGAWPAFKKAVLRLARYSNEK